MDALKLAAHEVLKNGRDVHQYQAICDDLRSLAPADPDSNANKQWIDRTNKANHAELHRLESELKGYKNNLVKESIRVRMPERSVLFWVCLLTAHRWATKI